MSDKRAYARRLPWAAMAATLAIALAACDNKTSMEPPNANIAGSTALKDTLPSAPDLVAEQASHASGDSALAAQVKSAIVSEPGLKSLTVEVNATDGVVTLFGTADTPAKRHQAALVALNVDGVRSVRNSMTVVSGS